MPNQMYPTLIVDDEPDARNVLRRLIDRYCPRLLVCAEAGTVADALAAIQEHRPALIFLDVDLRKGNGFDILDAYPKPGFQVIFTTAYDDFAVKAFQYRALHYLLKPIAPQELIAATNEIPSPAKFWPEYELLQQSLAAARQKSLSLPTIHGTVVIRADEISHIRGEDKYATVVLETGEKFFVSLLLKDMEESLPAGEFIRPHQSYLVRIASVRKVLKTDGVALVLKDKTEVPVSRRNREDVLRVLGIV